VWHNKSKAKAYGELFRTGDVVTVILDMDLGQLSYNLNDRPLGVALEGLVGPLYPAFSLYNEDDQLTVKQVKSKLDYPPRGADNANRSNGIGTCLAEALLTRVVSLDDLLSYILRDYLQEDATVGTMCESILSEVVAEDLWHRYKSLRKGVSLRSIEVAPWDVQLLDTSTVVCAAMTEGRLEQGNLVALDGRHYKVAGVANHKLWLQLLHQPLAEGNPNLAAADPDAEFFGFSTDELNQLLLSASLTVVEKN
jgi:hypothetical protein